MDAAAGERACCGRRGAVAGGPAAQQRKAGRDAGRVLREAVEAVVGPARRAVRVACRSSSGRPALFGEGMARQRDRKSTRLNSSHGYISYAVFCLKKKKKNDSTKPPAPTRSAVRTTSTTSPPCRSRRHP